MENDKKYRLPSVSERVEASSLRKRAEEVRKELEKERAQQHREEAHRLEEMERQTYLEFLDKEFTEADRLHVKDLTSAAVRAGEVEVQILHFPASYLDDKGRAINNAEKDWPKSLTGFAKGTYEAYVDIAKPLGYKLVARVLNFPNATVGDIGLFLKW